MLCRNVEECSCERGVQTAVEVAGGATSGPEEVTLDTVSRVAKLAGFIKMTSRASSPACCQPGNNV